MIWLPAIDRVPTFMWDILAREVIWTLYYLGCSLLQRVVGHLLVQFMFQKSWLFNALTRLKGVNMRSALPAQFCPHHQSNVRLLRLFCGRPMFKQECFRSSKAILWFHGYFRLKQKFWLFVHIENICNGVFFFPRRCNTLTVTHAPQITLLHSHTPHRMIIICQQNAVSLLKLISCHVFPLKRQIKGMTNRPSHASWLHLQQTNGRLREKYLLLPSAQSNRATEQGLSRWQRSVLTEQNESIVWCFLGVGTWSRLA